MKSARRWPAIIRPPFTPASGTRAVAPSGARASRPIGVSSMARLCALPVDGGGRARSCPMRTSAYVCRSAGVIATDKRGDHSRRGRGHRICRMKLTVYDEGAIPSPASAIASPISSKRTRVWHGMQAYRTPPARVGDGRRTGTVRPVTERLRDSAWSQLAQTSGFPAITSSSSARSRGCGNKRKAARHRARGNMLRLLRHSGSRGTARRSADRLQQARR